MSYKFELELEEDEDRVKAINEMLNAKLDVAIHGNKEISPAPEELYKKIANYTPTPKIIPTVGKRYNIKTKNGIKTLYLSYIKNELYYFIRHRNSDFGVSGTVYNIKNIINEAEER